MNICPNSNPERQSKKGDQEKRAFNAFKYIHKSFPKRGGWIFSRQRGHFQEMGRHHLEMSRMEKCKHWSGSLLPVRNLFQTKTHLAKPGGREHGVLESCYPASVSQGLGRAFPDREKISPVPLFISQRPALSKEPWYHIQACAKLWKF